MKIKVGISARHIHLSKADCDILFGSDYNITPVKDLYQTGEYACAEKVTIEGKKGKIDNVRLLGPIRDYTQVEISKTDSYVIGVNPPIRNSGDIEDAEALTIIGPKGSINKKCCIIATRHIHINDEDAKKYNFYNNQIVKVTIDGIKGGTLDNVYIKIADSYNLELHLDLDDANSHLLNQGDIVSVEENNNE